MTATHLLTGMEMDITASPVSKVFFTIHRFAGGRMCSTGFF